MYILSITSTPQTSVEPNAPINPSHVFLGDKLMSLVLPKKNPKRGNRKLIAI